MKVSLHVCRKLAQRLVEVVHLRENATDNHYDKNIGRGVRELVLARECHLDGEAERLDEHDRDRARGGADGEVDERVLATVFRCDLVDHEAREDSDEEAVEEEA